MEMKAESHGLQERYTRIIIVLLGIICVFLFFRALNNGGDIVIPFILAAFLLYILNPLIEFFERIKVPSKLAVMLSLVVTFAVLISLGVVINSSIQSFVEEFPKYEPRLHELTTSVMEVLNVAPESTVEAADGTEAVEKSSILENLSMATLLRNVVRAVGNFLSSMIMILIILLFMLMGRRQLSRKVAVAFKPDTAERISAIVSRINKQIQQYIVMKTVVSALTTVLVIIVMLFFGLEFVVIWALLTFLLNFIPTVGSIVAVLLPLSLAIIQYDSLATVGWLALALFVAQFSVGQVLDPKLVGQRINLSPVTILFSLIFWGAMWGIIGMFLAVPLTVVIKIIFENVEGLRFLSVLMSSSAEPVPVKIE